MVPRHHGWVLQTGHMAMFMATAASWPWFGGVQYECMVPEIYVSIFNKSLVYFNFILPKVNTDYISNNLFHKQAVNNETNDNCFWSHLFLAKTADAREPWSFLSRVTMPCILPAMYIHYTLFPVTWHLWRHCFWSRELFMLCSIVTLSSSIRKTTQTFSLRHTMLFFVS